MGGWHLHGGYRSLSGRQRRCERKVPQTIANDFRKFLESVRSKVPRCQKVIHISIKPSMKRWSMAEAMRKTNQQIREICETDETADFLDIWPLMLDDTGLGLTFWPKMVCI